ncbi:hypothetical protein [Profundibacter sp.]
MNIQYQTAKRLFLASVLLLVFIRMAPPLSWAQTQFLFTYDAGFQRRALLGEFLSWIFPQGITQENTYVIAALVTLSAVAVLSHYIIKQFSRLQNGGVLLVLFSFSIGLATFIGNTGNLDGMVLVMAIWALAMPKHTFGFVAIAALACAIGAMFHENMLPYFVPLVTFDIWLRNESQPMAQRMMRAAMPLMLTSICVMVLFAYGTHPLAEFDNLIEMLKARSIDFDIRATTLEPVLAIPDGMSGRLDVVWGTADYRFRLIAFAGVGLVFLTGFVGLILQATAHRPMMDRLLGFAVIISPLSLLFIAFDVSRFVAIAWLNAFLVIAVLARIDAEFRNRLNNAFTPVVVIALMVFQSHIALRDLNTQKQYLARFPGVILEQKAWFGRNQQ